MPLVKAKFKWEAQDAGELSFNVGDVIDVDNDSQEGWWHGSLNGQKGYFPNNYVEPMPASPTGRGPPPRGVGQSRVSTNASSVSQASGYSVSSRVSSRSTASQNSRAPLMGSRAASPGAASISSRSTPMPRGSPPPGGRLSSARPPPGGRPMSPPGASRAPMPQGGPMKQPQSSFRSGNNYSQVPTEDLSNISDREWDERARRKGPAPLLSMQQRMAAIDRLVADARRSTMITGSQLAGKPMAQGMGARELAANALRAVTLYDNNQNKGITTYEDFDVDTKKGEEMGMWAPTASTEAFTRTKYGVWASNMAIGSAYSMVFFGVISIVWGITDVFYGMLAVWLGVYSLGMSVIVAGFEYFKGYDRSGQPIPYRGVAYTLASGPLFATYPLIPAGAMLFLTALANFRSYMLREEVRPMKKKRKMMKAQDVQMNQGFFLSNFFRNITEGDKVGKIVFLTVFFIANAVTFYLQLEFWFDLNESLPPNDRLSEFGPYAKGFGALLDLNAAIILVPVARTFIRWLYNISTRDQGFWSTLMRYVLYFVPLDKTLAFHKLCAAMVFFATTGHTFFHFINLVNSERQTIALFGLGPWYTGGALILIMLVLYAAAMKNVKSYHFELFWYTHHLFIPFFILILIHGDGWINPNFWKVLILPGLLYTVERLLREYNANREAVILSVTFLKPDCFSVRFGKKGIFATPYKEGQYVFVNCPYVSKHEWHPFTLSSAPGEDAASLHIRIQNRQSTDGGSNEKSWTQQTKEYLELLSPRGAVYHEFISNAGQDIGVVKGPDGNPILRLDGPHSAPTQHVSEYQHSMIVGAGIGVTPLAATLKSIVHHRWRLALGNAFPNNAYFYWVCAHRDLQAFRWMIRTIKDATDAVWNSRLKDEQMKKRTFLVKVFITSAPKDAQPPPLESIPSDSVGFWGGKRKDLRNIENTPAPFTEQEMYQVCMAPPKEPVQMCELVTIISGRPNWDKEFMEVKNMHPSNTNIGVMFCGNPAIASALKHSCKKHSNATNNLYFKLHKENF